MWYRKTKIFSGERMSLTIGYDLWTWALVMLVDVDYGFASLELLCFSIAIGWEQK